MVSIGSPWRAVRSLVHLAVTEPAADDMVKAGAAVLAVVLAVLLIRGLLGAAISGAAGVPGAVGLPGTVLGGAAALALALAWLLAWPYVLPWYDGLAWALLPLAAASSLDWLLLARTAGLAFGYLPARVAGVVMPPGLGWLQSVVRTAVTPAILAAVIVWLIVSLRRGRPPSAAPSEPAGPAARAGLDPRGPAVAVTGGIRRAAEGRTNR
jgi:hypothetical protein